MVKKKKRNPTVELDDDVHKGLKDLETSTGIPIKRNVNNHMRKLLKEYDEKKYIVLKHKKEVKSK